MTNHVPTWVRSTLPLIVSALCVAGCAPRTQARHVKSWRDASIHRVLVVCVQRGPDLDRQIEAYMAPIMRRQGLDAVPSQDMFPVAADYSPQALFARMRQAEMDGIMEVSYSGPIPKEGLPQGLVLRYHSIKGANPKLSDSRGSLDVALAGLLAGLAR